MSLLEALSSWESKGAGSFRWVLQSRRVIQGFQVMYSDDHLTCPYVPWAIWSIEMAEARVS